MRTQLAPRFKPIIDKLETMELSKLGMALREKRGALPAKIKRWEDTMPWKEGLGRRIRVYVRVGLGLASELIPSIEPKGPTWNLRLAYLR